MHYQLIILGGGTAAIAAIAEALELGVERIACIEQREAIGGECALNGCVPLHTIARGAKIAHTLQQAAEAGLVSTTGKLDFAALMRHVEAVVQSGLEDPYADEPRVTRYRGHGAFVSPHEIRIDGPEGQIIIAGDQIIIATGTKQVIPDIAGLAETRYWLYPDATHAKLLPESLAIIGGGRIGIEFAQLFQRLGSRVTLFEIQKRLLCREDEDASAALLALLQAEGVTVHLNADIAKVEARNGKKTLHFLSANQAEQSVDVQGILVTTGRCGCPQDLNPDAAGIAYDDTGITIDDRCRTTVEHIWAVGDVVGPYRFTHAADYQAVVAVHNALRFRENRVNYNTMPIAYYSEPPLARVGMTEAQARRNFQSVIILKRLPDQVTRMRIEGETQGFCKVIVDGDTDQILGAHIMAAHADDMIHLVSLAMHAGISVPQMAQMVYAYPTRAQLLQKTLELYRKARTEVSKVAFGVLHSGDAVD